MAEPAGDACCPPEAPRARFGLAFAVACPACAGGAVLVIGTAFGASVAALKGILLATGAAIVAMLWIRNAWRRRGEGKSQPGP